MSVFDTKMFLLVQLLNKMGQMKKCLATGCVLVIDRMYISHVILNQVMLLCVHFDVF